MPEPFTITAILLAKAAFGHAAVGHAAAAAHIAGAHTAASASATAAVIPPTPVPGTCEVVGAKIAVSKTATAMSGSAAAAHGHAASYLLAGLVAGSTLFAIGVRLEKLVKAGHMTKKQAGQLMNKAKGLPEPKQVEMLGDVEKLMAKWNVK